jgi:hypothetical protein
LPRKVSGSKVGETVDAENRVGDLRLGKNRKKAEGRKVHETEKEIVD